MAERFSDQKFLSGNFAPIRFEADAPDLEIEGDFPESLRGTLYRNGPNPQFSPRDRYHIFSGDGSELLQTVEFNTSCSQLLLVGDQFGGVVIEDCTPESD